ncbi:hypothetical protein SAMN04487850_0143 [Prevotella aff. ruminicola Tc2-24]|jgi:hypothetical protein|uniref:Uncharacterized protein n=1 Tax=Prevotella aff. ruminicola Tc2-24 TaxID=81582 RepID=A0A1I0LZE7_9BACT|nr:hypothetical protein SAMN04487850_0143 [Prevotella aff. ruminicola Tc2-24]
MLCKGTSFFRNFIIFDDDFRAKKHATQDRNLSDGIKKETSFFVLRSTFSNFAIRDGELTPSRHKKD